jgi:AraC-like DNA-binding protein
VAGRYAERPVGGALGALAEAAWVARFDAPADDWLVLPDGCVDLVVTTGRAAVVAGPATAPSVLAYPAETRAVGLRLRPGAAAAVLGVAAHELRDRVVPAAALPALAGLGEAEDALAGGDPGAALAALVRATGTRAAAAGARADPRVGAAAALLRATPGLGLAALERELALSARQLRRRFGEHVGVGPARFARVARLQRVLARHRADPGLTGAALAADAGYADQPHLARDCRELAGRGLGALLAQRDAVA